MSTKYFGAKKSGSAKPKRRLLKVGLIATIALAVSTAAGFAGYKMIQSGVDRAVTTGQSTSPRTTSPQQVYQPRQEPSFFNRVLSTSKGMADSNTSAPHSQKKFAKETGKKHGKHFAKHSKKKHGKHFAKHSKKKHGKHFAKHSKKKHGKHFAKDSKMKHGKHFAKHSNKKKNKNKHNKSLADR